jgi:hypothetical protein
VPKISCKVPRHCHLWFVAERLAIELVLPLRDQLDETDVEMVFAKVSILLLSTVLCFAVLGSLGNQAC